MRLTNYTDYSLRVLIFLALKKDGELSKIKEIAENYNISKNHLMKIIHQLGQLGYIETIRGRNGGIKLAKDPKEINIGRVVSKTEDDFHIIDCFQQCGDYCATSPSCKLKYALYEALQAFLKILNGYTLENLVQNKEDLSQLFSSSLEH
ncbi:Rrf2 family transcriptional regulator [Priestia flexa]|uniref:Rrf2 family transcriptional regulator n=1 Tax=Priestia flexa TaxID=86664 RepID=UPI00099D473B|nr:Rrf2 family transcriptional regulator [Priestia flexa]AQX54160.1 Rrf2 family transcriptional regulator [Priestia flexa]